MRVLAVGCHPDDLEIACSGTLRKYVEQGADVYMCHVANGNLGHVVIEPGPLAEIRTKEAEAAGAIIGAKQVFNLNVGDMRVDSHDQDVIDAMADVVRFVRPDVIITHNDDDYMQDHTETSTQASPPHLSATAFTSRVPRIPAQVDVRARQHRFRGHGAHLLQVSGLPVRRGLRRGLPPLQRLSALLDPQPASLTGCGHPAKRCRHGVVQTAVNAKRRNANC